MRKKLTLGAFALSGIAVLSLITAPNAVGIESVADSVVHGPGGLRYTTVSKSYKNLPVVGGGAVVVTDAAGTVLSQSGDRLSTLSLDTTPKITAEQATGTAKGLLATVESAEPAQLVVHGPSRKLAYEARAFGTRSDGRASNLRVWVDALTGQVIGQQDLVRGAEGHSAHNGDVTIESSKSGADYQLVDGRRPNVKQGTHDDKKIFTKPTDVWGTGDKNNIESAGVDAAYAAEQEWDLLKAWFGRDGFDGKGKGFPAYVGWNVANAQWTGSYTRFGRNNKSTQQLTSIDVVAHEYGHAIFQFSGTDGIDGAETAGINESVADIFGTLTEFYAGNPVDKPDYTVGEEVDARGDGKPIRWLYQPSLDGKSPDYYSPTIGTLDEHYGAGPHSHWFYLLAEGSKPANGNPVSPTADGKEVGGIGLRKAGEIFYSGLQRKGNNWSYLTARAATVQAAKDLYGAGSVEVKTTKAAWDAVKVPAQPGEPG
ncbi:M4 family peptidase [Pseudonocardiaceae bacterium YIM PH 21723]|nr:M4 family peptidase [Pseudonocardiaceae bacterium YIM PH 21723]